MEDHSGTGNWIGRKATDSRRTAPPRTGTAPSKSQLMALFPNPGLSLTVETPVRWPGISAASTVAVREYLQQDYEQHHGFFNNRGFHNHTPFHLLTEYSLGAGPAHLTAIWNQHVALERPAFQSPDFITTETFTDHLGDEAFYQAYLHFFSDLLLKKPVHAVLEEWIFSSKANYDTKKNGQRPEMLNRLLASVMHPLIYVGFGLDFRTLTGLAQAAVHKLASSALLPRHMFDTSTMPSFPHTRGAHPAGTHAFSILSRILRDPGFNNLIASFDEVHVNPKEVAKKVEELTFLNVMIHVVGGWRDGGFRQAEFTFSITLPSYMTVISSPASKSLLLRAYFSRSLAYYISRGRPNLDIHSFFSSSTPLNPTFPGTAPTPYASAFPAPTSPGALTPNPWLQIIQSALVHPDDHLCKVQRALAHYGSLYGDMAPGEFKDTELEGSEVIDGTLFVRAAGLTMERMGRVREGEKDRFWANDPNHPGW
ncbi:hypothetical protein DFH09DRAFT_1265090 [Mycena vulgaris]|nr:hypothetical protein DFH09DRAFT_1265090 [Mycena vulgaris]